MVNIGKIIYIAYIEKKIKNSSHFLTFTQKSSKINSFGCKKTVRLAVFSSHFSYFLIKEEQQHD